MSRDDNFADQDEPVYVPVYDEDTGEETLVSTAAIREAAEVLFVRDDIDDDALWRESVVINRMLIMANAFYGDFMNLHNYPSRPTKRQHFRWTIDVALADAEEILRDRKIRQTKNRILNSLQEDYQETATISYTDNSLHVTKL